MMQDPAPAGHLSPLIYTKVHIPGPVTCCPAHACWIISTRTSTASSCWSAPAPATARPLSSWILPAIRTSRLLVHARSLRRRPAHVSGLSRRGRAGTFPILRRADTHAAGAGPRGTVDLRSTIGVLVNEFVEQIPEFMAIVLDDYHTVEPRKGSTGPWIPCCSTCPSTYT